MGRILFPVCILLVCFLIASVMDGLQSFERGRAIGYKEGANDMACIVGVKEKCPTKEHLMERLK